MIFTSRECKIAYITSNSNAIGAKRPNQPQRTIPVPVLVPPPRLTGAASLLFQQDLVGAGQLGVLGRTGRAANTNTITIRSQTLRRPVT